MPVTRSFPFNPNGQAGIDATGEIANINFLGFDGSGLSVFVNGTQSLDDAPEFTGRLRAEMSLGEDLDENGTADLVEAFIEARDDIGLTLTPGQFRDLILRFGQVIVERKNR